MIDAGEVNRRPARRRYPMEEASALYVRHLEGEPGAIDELMYYAKRFMIILINKLYRRFDRDSKEEILSICLFHVWRAASKKMIKRGVRTLHGYMYRIVLKMGGRAAKRMTAENFLEKIDYHEYMRWYFARLPDAREVEAEILITELPTALRKQALQYSDLLCPKQRAATQYIVNRLLSGERILPVWLRRNYGVTNVRYFVEHAFILIRRAMYDMQKDCLNFASDEEKRSVLDGGMEAYLRFAG